MVNGGIGKRTNAEKQTQSFLCCTGQAKLTLVELGAQEVVVFTL